MDFSKLSYADIRSISNSLNSKAKSMEGILDNVKTQFNRIGTDNVWSGTSASQTKEEFDKLAAEFHTFHEAVTSCANYLEKMVENYEAVDRAVQGK